MKMALGSDHGGFDIKEILKASLAERGIDVKDFGCHSRDAVDYPDFAFDVAQSVASQEVDQGILVCKTGIGMVIAANKFPRVRAALCLTPIMAATARTHNNANVLTIAGQFTDAAQAKAILDSWLNHAFEGGERHARRVRKIDQHETEVNELSAVLEADPEIFSAIQAEERRQRLSVNLIASENYVSRAVKQAQGCVMTNKYAEGYPGRRWYNGCEWVDMAEQLAIDRAKALFGADHANVQPHCGSAANMAVYFSLLQPGDTILAMNLAHGGHLTHGSPVNFSGRLFHIVPYGVNRETETLDYDELAGLAEQHRPKLIVAGASAYPRRFDFPRLRKIADSVGARLMVDIAHIAGLVAAGCHPSPVPYADFVTSTTHKTLRGPRAGLVLCRQEFAAAIDKQVFPGLQGGPLMHVIAAKAVCFHEAAQPAFKRYGEQIIRNAQAMAEVFEKEGFRLVSGGTDNHLMLLDLSPNGMTGKDAAAALDRAGIVVNKNTIPFDKQSPFVTSGIRIGSPAMTTRGMKEPEARAIASMIVAVLNHIDNQALQDSTRMEVESLTARFPIW